MRASSRKINEELLQAALKVVSEKGYLGATTREIARQAGVTELTLFRHFGSKEKLFGGLLETHTFLPKLKELLAELESLSYEEALRLIATRFLLSLKERKSMIKIMHSEINLYPEKIRKVYTTTIEDMRITLAQYFASLRKQGTLRQVSPSIAARMFLGMFFSYFRAEEIMQGKDITKNGQMERHVRGFVDIFVHGTLSRGR